jgi:YesN/AraC family two-component response regulator
MKKMKVSEGIKLLFKRTGAKQGEVASKMGYASPTIISNAMARENLTVDLLIRICNELNYSRTYLSKIFKAATGYTILDYIILSKIREAKKLIREERYNFTQISDLLAFNNPHYFSAVFKNFTNMTPSDYKNSVIKS